MAVIYSTKENEVLDSICWKHYRRSKLKDALFLQEPEYMDFAEEVEELFDIDQMMGTGQDLQGITEKVLEANPGLADYGSFLPSGVLITLPNLEAESTNKEVVRLWD